MYVAAATKPVCNTRMNIQHVTRETTTKKAGDDTQVQFAFCWLSLLSYMCRELSLVLDLEFGSTYCDVADLDGRKV